MKSIVLLAFTLCLVGLLSTLALLSHDAASPLSRQLLRRGNRAHAPGFFNVDDSTSSDSSSPRGASDGRRVVLVGSQNEANAVIAKVKADAEAKGKKVEKALARFNAKYEIVISPPRKVVDRTFENGKPIVDPRQIEIKRLN